MITIILLLLLLDCNVSVQQLETLARQAADYPHEEITSAGFSGTIQRTLVRRLPGLLDLFHHPCVSPQTCECSQNSQCFRCSYLEEQQQCWSCTTSLLVLRTEEWQRDNLHCQEGKTGWFQYIPTSSGESHVRLIIVCSSL